jgi:hypothetical protein
MWLQVTRCLRELPFSEADVELLEDCEHLEGLSQHATAAVLQVGPVQVLAATAAVLQVGPVPMLAATAVVLQVGPVPMLAATAVVLQVGPVQVLAATAAVLQVGPVPMLAATAVVLQVGPVRVLAATAAQPVGLVSVLGVKAARCFVLDCLSSSVPWSPAFITAACLRDVLWSLHPHVPVISLPPPPQVAPADCSISSTAVFCLLFPPTHPPTPHPRNPPGNPQRPRLMTAACQT